MNRVLSLLVTIAWGVWFGAMGMLFVALASIFKSLPADRETAGNVAAGLFPKFERMQLILAGVCLLGTSAWYLAAKSRAKLALFALFAVATMIAVVETTSVTPRIEEMRIRGERGTPQFERAHRLSERVYTAGAVVLLFAGVALPGAIRSDVQPKVIVPPQTAEENPPA